MICLETQEIQSLTRLRISIESDEYMQEDFVWLIIWNYAHDIVQCWRHYLSYKIHGFWIYDMDEEQQYIEEKITS